VPNLVQQVQRAGNVGVDHVLHVGKILLQKALAQSMPGIGQQCIHGASGDGLDQRVHTLTAGELGLHHLDVGAQHAQVTGRLVQCLVGRDHQVKTLFGAAAGQVETDAGGGSSNNGKGAIGVGHGTTPETSHCGIAPLPGSSGTSPTHRVRSPTWRDDLEVLRGPGAMAW